MKQVLLNLIIGILLISCQDKQPKEENFTSENEKIIERYFNHFNKHEWTQMAEMYIDSAEFKDPSFGTGTVKQSHSQIVDKYKQLQEVFPDLHDQVIKTYMSNPNIVVVEFISIGTGLDKIKFELPICTIFKIENGKIIADYTYYDN